MAMTLKALVIGLLLTFLISNGSAQQQGTKKREVIYKYKKKETIDLGSLEIQGQIIAPGDLSIEKRSRKVFTRELHSRPHFKNEIKDDIDNLR